MGKCVVATCVLGAGLCFLVSNATASGVLAAHWKLNEAPGSVNAFDSGPSGFTGTLHNGAAFIAGGVSGNAVTFNRSSNDYVDMGFILPFTGNVAFSVSTWVKSLSAQNDIFVGRHDSGFPNGYFLADNAGAGYGLTNKAYSYASVPPGSEPISTTNVTDGFWHHVVLTYTPGGLTTIFVDGKREATRPAFAIVPDTVAFMLGAITVSGTKTGAFTGQLDDVQVYSGALNGPQVCAIFHNPGQAAPAICDGDTNGDHFVSFADLNAVLSAFGQAGSCLSTDFDGDGTVNFADLNVVLSAFGQPC